MTYWSNAYVVEWNRKIFLRLRNKVSCKRLKRRIFLKLIMWVPKTGMPAWSLEDKQLEIPTQILHKYLHLGTIEQFYTSFICRMWFFCWIYVHQIFPPRNETRSTSRTGGPSSSCEMIILRNNCHGGIIRPLSLMKRTHFSELSISRFFLCTYKLRNGQPAKMGSFHQSKWSDNKWYAVEVR